MFDFFLLPITALVTIFTDTAATGFVVILSLIGFYIISGLVAWFVVAKLLNEWLKNVWLKFFLGVTIFWVLFSILYLTLFIIAKS